MNLGKFFWGLLIIFIGIVLILTNFGYLSLSIWVEMLRLWPVIIIVIGLSILSKGLSRPVQAIFNVIVILAAAFLIVAFFNPARQKFEISPNRNSETQTTQFSESLSEESKRAKIDISTGAAELMINSTSEELLEGSVTSSILQPTLERTTKSNVENVKISGTGKNNFTIFSGKNTWDLSITDKIPIELILSTGAVDAELDLADMIVENLTVKSGASSYEVTLGDKADTLDAEIDLGASSLKLRIPRNVGINIQFASGLTSNNFQAEGLVRSDRNYKSEGYEQASKKYDFKINTGASSVDLDLY